MVLVQDLSAVGSEVVIEIIQEGNFVWMVFLFCVRIIVLVELVLVNVGCFDGDVAQAKFVISWLLRLSIHVEVGVSEIGVGHDAGDFVGFRVQSFKLKHQRVSVIMLFHKRQHELPHDFVDGADRHRCRDVETQYLVVHNHAGQLFDLTMKALRLVLFVFLLRFLDGLLPLLLPQLFSRSVFLLLGIIGLLLRC